MFVGWLYMKVSQNGGPESSIFVGFSIISHPFTPKPSIEVGLSIINHPLLGTFILGNLYIYILYISWVSWWKSFKTCIPLVL